MFSLYIIIIRLADLLTLAIFARAIISWFPISPYNPVSILLYRITEPLLEPLRRYLPRTGMMDLTPLIAILILQFGVKTVFALLL